MLRNDLVNYIANLLDISRFRDYCPNGLQVEGRSEVQRLVGGVTANNALLTAAVSRQADAILVHHGFFWKGESTPVIGLKQQRLSTLLRHDINLLAYHLPLDAHAEFGNNAQLGALLGLATERVSGEQGLLCWAKTDQSAAAIMQTVESGLGKPPLIIGDPNKPIRNVAWCTGGAQNFFPEAVDGGADLYITGEISEPMVHLARDSGVVYLAAGHHATERGGVSALGAHLQNKFGISFEFIDVPSPV